MIPPIYPIYVIEYHLKYAVEYLTEDRLYIISRYSIQHTLKEYPIK